VRAIDHQTSRAHSCGTQFISTSVLHDGRTYCRAPRLQQSLEEPGSSGVRVSQAYQLCTALALHDASNSDNKLVDMVPLDRGRDPCCTAVGLC